MIPSSPHPDDARPDEVDDEIAFHLEQRTRDFIAAGHDPEEAARLARAAFGDIERIRRTCTCIDKGEHPMLHRIHMAVTALLLLAVLGLGWSLYSAHIRTIRTRVSLQNTMAQLEVAEQRQAEAASHRNTGVVYVAGPAVARPGTYALPATGNLTLRRVLIAASLERLDEGICTIQRGDQRIEVDLGGDEDPVLLPEDVVTVR
ncbi:MAG: hypothetical protein KDA21_11485 [Phycisphaerales bacterium]|nr:hypothetical protein [Phycisphaerales bacterium]